MSSIASTGNEKSRTAVLATAAGVLAISAAAVILQGPAPDAKVVDDRVFSHRIVISATIGAADGMAASGWSNDDLGARVDALRSKGPVAAESDSLKNNGMRIENEYLGHVRDAAFDQAAAGKWSEDALLGYLQVAEMSREDVVSGVHAALPELADGDISGMRIRGSAEIMSNVQAAFSTTYPHLEAAQEYSALALTQIATVNMRNVERLRRLSYTYQAAEIDSPKVILSEISDETGIMAAAPDENMLRTWPQLASADMSDL